MRDPWHQNHGKLGLVLTSYFSTAEKDLGSYILSSPLVILVHMGLRIPVPGVILISPSPGHALQATTVSPTTRKLSVGVPHMHSTTVLPSLQVILVHYCLCIFLDLFKNAFAYSHRI